MANRSKELLEYKQKIMALLLQSPKILELMLQNEPDISIKNNPNLLINKRLYYTELETYTIEDTLPIICFDALSNIDRDNPTFKDMTIHFWITCNVGGYHDSITGLPIPDLISLEIEDALLDENFSSDPNKSFGIKLEMTQNSIYYPSETQHGRVLTFITKEFKDGRKYGR